jgi:transketolase
LNGFNAAHVHRAPIVFVMHRNGIQLSGPTDRILNKDPRPIVESLGVRVLEIASLHDRPALFGAYRAAAALARDGQPSLIYPVGYSSAVQQPVTLRTFGEMYGVLAETEQFAGTHGVALDRRIWIPGSLMSFRDVHAMLECVFYVNHLPGGEGHHDGGMKSRDGDAVLANPMLRMTDAEAAALRTLRSQAPRVVVTEARPPKGSPNLTLSADDVRAIQLPGTDKWITARAGSEAAYAALARKYPKQVFIASCDLNPSTKLGKAAGFLPAANQFELSIEEQAAALLINGLSLTGNEPQLNVFATFAAFFEGIAREGFEFWRYQRNLSGVNEGLNVVMHLSHVGACTGRDHFSGWSLDWINLALGYLPYLRRFYAPADARAAFLAIRDAAAGMGGHIVGIPRDNLPILTKGGGNAPLWEPHDEWTPVTAYRQHAGANAAVLALGAPAFLAGGASERATEKGSPTDVYVINGFPLPDDFMSGLAQRYSRLVTIEDGLIGGAEEGLRGFAAYVATRLRGADIELDHLGITDPRVAPSDHFVQVWEHYGITEEALLHSLVR